MKSERNKTIDISVEEGREYLDRCLTLEAPASEETVRDKIILGDSFDVSERLPRSFVDLLIVDPPYNMSKDFNGLKFDRMGAGEYREYTLSWLDRCMPLLKPGASVYVCCDWFSSLVVGAALGERLKVRNRITWQREKGRGAAKNWKNGMEDIWFATVSDDYTFNLDAVKVRRRVVAPYRKDGEAKDWFELDGGRFRDTCPSNFWDDVSVPYWSMSENTAHPAQKPEKLLAKLILAGSNENDMVFDPFIGSGSTAVAAKKLKRHFCGVEHNPLYCVWAQKRLENAERDSTIQGMHDGVFYERNARHK